MRLIKITTMRKKASENQLKKFRLLLKKVSPSNIVDDLKESTLREIFENNFESNISLAEKVLFHRYGDVNRQEYPITNMESASSKFTTFARNKTPILLVTDNDNDGSLAQAVMIESKRLMPEEFSSVEIEFAQNLNENRLVHGITVELVEAWADKKGFKKDDKFLVVTADNGIQSKEDTDKILKKFPNAEIIITDHHLPSKENTPKESERLSIVDPKYKSRGFFKDNPNLNISGAHVLSIFMKNVIRRINPNIDPETFEVLDSIEKHSTSMDFVNSLLQNYPLSNHEIKENSELRALMNVNNSIKSFVHVDIDEDTIQKIIQAAPEMDIKEIKDATETIKNLNLLASKYIVQYREFKSLSPEAQLVFDNSMFYKSTVKSLSEDFELDDLNTNYIEQLRPIVFHALSNPNKSGFEAAMFEQIKDLFLDLKKIENKIVKQIRSADLFYVVKAENATLVYPKDFDAVKLFGRKLLMKAYNLNNDGALFFVSHNSPESSEGHYIVNGSGRTIDIKNEEIVDFVDQNIRDFKIECKGHDNAFGVFLKSNKEIGIKSLENFIYSLSDHMSQKRSLERVGGKYYDEDFYLLDSTNLNEALVFNSSIKGYLPNKSALNPVIKLSRSSRFLDKETKKAITVGEVLKKEAYGYSVIELNFAGDAVILPVETIRALSENNFKDFIQIAQIDGSAFIANRVVEKKKINPSRIIKIKSVAKGSQDKIIKDIIDMKNLKGVKVVSRDIISGMDIFKRNVNYGEQEFDRCEENILNMIDLNGLDYYSILDVEANGLGRPELFNLGMLDCSIIEGSGIKVPFEEYLKIKDHPKKLDLFKDKYLDGENIKNVKIDEENKEIIINRELKYEIVSKLARSNDFNLLEPVSNLTGVNQSILNKYGESHAEIDNFCVNRYSGKKVSFVIHNAPYDTGVMSANLPKFSEFMRESSVICDTAPLAKQNALGYADMEVSVIDGFRDALFYDNPIADYSLTNMLKSKGDFVYPDIRGEFVLKRRGEKLFLIDKKDNIENEMPYSTKFLLSDNSPISSVPLPKNKLKYGIQFLLKTIDIRSMILSDIENNIESIETPDEIKEMGLDNLFQEFCEGYNFGGDFTKNLINFVDHLASNRPEHYSLIIKTLFQTPDQANIALYNNEEVEKNNLKVSQKLNKDIQALEKKLKTGKINEEEFNIKLKELNKNAESKMATFDNLGIFKNGLNEFLLKNKEIYLQYTNSWEYHALLSVYDPIKKVTAQADLDRVCYQTSLPEDRVRRMIDKIYTYKKSIGIEKEPFYTPELHNNFNHEGDAVIEHFAVLALLNALHHNRYSNTPSQMPVKILNRQYSESNQRFKKSYDIVYHIYNSASTGQLRNYSNRKDSDGKLHVSDLVLEAKKIQDVLLKSTKLQEGMIIVCDKKVSDIGDSSFHEEIKDDLDFILTYNLIRNSKTSIIELNKIINDQAGNLNVEHLIDVFWQEEMYKIEPSEYSNILDRFGLEYNDRDIKGLTAIKDIINFSVSAQIHENDFTNEILSGLKDEYVQAYKRVYDKVGYFYVSNERSETKKILDSIQENLKADTNRVKFAPKTINEYSKNGIKKLFTQMLADFAEENIKISDSTVVDIAKKIDGLSTVDEDINALKSEAIKVMKCEKIAPEDLLAINPLCILETKKNDPAKALMGYSGLLNKYLKNQRDEILSRVRSKTRIDAPSVK